MTTRVYVTGDWEGLFEWLHTSEELGRLEDEPLGPTELTGYAVTPALRSELPDCDDEELEYAAMTAAAQESLTLLRDETPDRRFVIVVEGAVTEVPESGPSVVRVECTLPDDIVAFHVDAPEAGATVRAAWLADLTGDARAEELAERCADLELMWFAADELPEVQRIYAGG